MLDRETAERYASWFRALSDGTRVQLLAWLAERDDPVSVAAITAALPVGQSTVSHHLSALAAVGFVTVEHRGTRSLYSVNSACVSCFPTAADLVMGREPADPPRVTTSSQD